MFKIIGGDGKEYGPVPAEELRQWIAQGRANVTTRALRDGTSDWKTLGDFPEFAAAPAPGGGPPPLSAAGTTAGGGAPKTSGMAIASLICGIFPCAALFGLIFGFLALSKIKNSGGSIGGRGLAIAGICLSGFFMLLSLIAIPMSLALPAVASARERAAEIKCVSNMKQIALGCKMWESDHNGQFPASLSVLTNELGGYSSVLICPKVQPVVPRVPWDQFDFSKVTYVYEAPPKDNTDLSRVILRCPLHGHAAHADGSVDQGPRTRRK